MTPPRYDPLDGPPDNRAPAGGGARTGWRARQRHGVKTEAIGYTDAFAAPTSMTSSAPFVEVGMYGGPFDGTAYVVPRDLIRHAKDRHGDPLARPITIDHIAPATSPIYLGHLDQAGRAHATYRLVMDGEVPKLKYVTTRPLRR